MSKYLDVLEYMHNKIFLEIESLISNYSQVLENLD